MRKLGFKRNAVSRCPMLEHTSIVSMALRSLACHHIRGTVSIGKMLSAITTWPSEWRILILLFLLKMNYIEEYRLLKVGENWSNPPYVYMYILNCLVVFYYALIGFFFLDVCTRAHIVVYVSGGQRSVFSIFLDHPRAYLFQVRLLLSPVL